MARMRDKDFGDISGMKQRLDELLDEAWNKFDLQQRVRENGCWQPVTDAYETPEKYVIQMELAGLTKDEVDVEIRGSELAVSGQRLSSREERRFSHQVLERFFGPFCRRFKLPHGADPEGIRARMENGLLVIVVPKAVEPQEKQQIEVVDE